MVSNLLRSTVFRLTLVTVALLGLAAAVVVAGVGLAANRALMQATQAAIAGDVHELRAAFEAGGVERLRVAVAERGRGGGAGLYSLEDQRGLKLAGNVSIASPGLEAIRPSGTFAYRPAGGSALRTAAGVRIDLDGQHALVIARDIEEQRQLLATLSTALITGLGVLGLIGLGGGVLLARRVLGRIDAMSAASRTIMAGDLAGRIPRAGSNDELDRLADQLNAMLERIERLMAGLREVSDNIAHDLKTPLNRLRNRAETALADSRGGAVWRDGLERTIVDADELIKTFNALLLIARLEAGTLDDALETVDLAEVATGVAELYEPAAEEAGFRIALMAGARAPIRANRQLIVQALANLIDNAIKYSAIKYSAVNTDRGRADATIAVVVEPGERERTVRVSVGDRGPGIAAADREHALKRFGRLDASRTQPGTGLGLSLVAAVARMHGATLRLEDNQPGLRVVLELPLVAGRVDVPVSIANTEAGGTGVAT